MKYEYTQTLKPQLYEHTNKVQYDRTVEMLKDILKPWKSTLVAELTQDHNIHYHAVIDMPDDIKERDRFHNRIRPYRKSLGRYTFKPVQYEQSFNRYIQKDLKITFKIVDRNPYPLDQLNLISPFNGVVVASEPSVTHKEGTPSLAEGELPLIFQYLAENYKKYLNI